MNFEATYTQTCDQNPVSTVWLWGGSSKDHSFSAVSMLPLNKYLTRSAGKYTSTQAGTDKGKDF